MTAKAERADVSPLVRWLIDHTGLDFDRSHGDRMIGAVREALAGSGAVDADAYVEVLERDGEALEEITDRLTVGETYFMREPVHFELLRSTVIPERLAERRRPLRIWSAGCASGEEPYSVAITLDEIGVLDQAMILGTDLSERALARARAGRYGRWSLRRCSDEERTAWFERDGDRWQVRDRHREAVRWRVAGILDGPPGRSFDVALCRNVLIYLTGDAVREAAAVLHDALAPGGWLLVGASDPPLVHPGLERVPGIHGIVYRRRGRTSAMERWPADPVPAPVAPLPTPTSRSRPGRPPLDTSTRPPRHAPEPTTAPRSADDAADAQLRCRAALTHLEAGRLAEARREAAAAHYLAPTLVDPHLVLAHASDLAGDVDAAARAYRNAIAALDGLAPDATVALLGEPAGQLVDALIGRLAELSGARR